MKNNMKLTKSKLKQIVQEELQNASKEVMIVVGNPEDLKKIGPLDVKDVSTPEKAEKKFADITKSVQKEETVDEAGPYGTSASRPAGSSWEGRTSPNPTGVWYVGDGPRDPHAEKYDTLDAAKEAAKNSRYNVQIYDSEGREVRNRG